MYLDPLFSLMQLTFLLPIFLILYLVNCLFLFHYLFFQWFSIALTIENSSIAFSFCLTFSASVNLGETVIYCGLEWVFLCASVPMQTLCAQ